MQYYMQLTIQPKLPLTEEECEKLDEAGLTCECPDNDGTFYVYTEGGCDEDVLNEVLSNVVRRMPEDAEIIVQGAEYAGRAVPEAQGGFIGRYTHKGHQWGSTSTVLSMMKDGSWGIEPFEE